ncbi:MAG TPA: DUF5666 domain-containing protein [Patescibacteria group bacterium]|nr:DUF5666 domain-containing protein [Patescibacteria group bacterium]
MKKNLPIVIAIVALVAAGSFYGGMKYQASKTPSRGQFTGGPEGMFGPGGANRAGNSSMSFINGEIISKDDQSVTVKLNNGGSKTVYYSASTTIGKMATGTPEDLSVGAPVMITGKSNTDGNVTAESIQIRNGQEPIRAGAPAPTPQQ